MVDNNMDYKKDSKVDYKNFVKYAFGGTGFSMTNMMILTYLTFFCTDILGVSSLTVAGLMLVTNIIDAVTDPLMGLIADHTRSKYGRYRPYIMFGAPVLGVLIFLLFSGPNLSYAMKVVFLYVVYISYSLAFTVVGVSFTALVPVMAKESSARTTLVSWKNIMIQVGRLVITSFSLPIVELLGSGQVGWARYGALVGVIITLCFWFVAWGAKPYDTVDFEIKRQKISMKSEIHLITKNKPLMMLMVAFGTDMLANSSLLAVNIYYFKYVLGRVDLVPITAIALTISGVLTNIALPFLGTKISKKKLYWFGSLLSILPLAVLMVKPVVPVSVLLMAITLYGFISTVPAALAWSMLSDCSDYSEYIVGVKGSGVVSSTFSFVHKFGGALGASFASLLLGFVGFAANQEQTKVVLTTIVFLRFGLPILAYIASLISMYFYDLTEEKNMEIRKVLDERAKIS